MITVANWHKSRDLGGPLWASCSINLRASAPKNPTICLKVLSKARITNDDASCAGRVKNTRHQSVFAPLVVFRGRVSISREVMLGKYHKSTLTLRASTLLWHTPSFCLLSLDLSHNKRHLFIHRFGQLHDARLESRTRYPCAYILAAEMWGKRMKRRSTVTRGKMQYDRKSRQLRNISRVCTEREKQTLIERPLVTLVVKKQKSTLYCALLITLQCRARDCVTTNYAARTRAVVVWGCKTWNIKSRIGSKRRSGRCLQLIEIKFQRCPRCEKLIKWIRAHSECFSESRCTGEQRREIGINFIFFR